MSTGPHILAGTRWWALPTHLSTAWPRQLPLRQRPNLTGQSSPLFKGLFTSVTDNSELNQIANLWNKITWEDIQCVWNAALLIQLFNDINNGLSLSLLLWGVSRPSLGGLLSSSYRQHQESLTAERERRRLEREERLQRIEREERNRFKWVPACIASHSSVLLHNFVLETLSSC